MKSPRRSTRSTKSHSLFSFSQWKLQDEYWTSLSKRLRKAAKKTSTQDITAKPIDGRTEGQDLNKQEIGGADYTSDKEGTSLIISGVKSIGYPSSTASHNITEKSCSADGNCVNERNVIKEKTQLKVTWIAESTDMIVDRKKAGGNRNIVPSAIPSFPNDMENSSSGIICDIPSFKPYSTDDFQPRQNVTVDRPRPSVIMETHRGIIGRGWPQDRDTIGMETPRDIISRGEPHGHDYAKIAFHPLNVTEVGSASGKVDTPTMYLTKELAEAREAVSSQEGAQLGVEVVNYSVVTQMKIKMEIELSTAQFIEVAHVLPALGSSNNYYKINNCSS